MPDGTGPSEKPRSLWSDAWRDLRRNPVFIISALIILVLVFISLWPGVIATQNPLKCDLAKAQEGSQPGHPFGFNGQGCDVYTRTVYGARASVTVGICATAGVAANACDTGRINASPAADPVRATVAAASMDLITSTAPQSPS